MCAFTRRRFWKALRYRLGILGVCLAYMLAALEIPLPVFVHKTSGQPFPCQNHACGCQTAEQCWSHCCCFTPEERWAWAREHNVEPPAYAEKPAAPPSSPLNAGANEGGQGWNTVKLRDRDNDTKSKTCCCAGCQPAAPARNELPGGTGWRMTKVAPWRCQGYSTLWISTGSVLLASSPTFTLGDAPPSRICLPSVRADIVPSTPPDPPPRLSLV